MAALISSAFSSQAANREILKQTPGNSAVHSQAGLAQSELRAERGMTYASGWLLHATNKYFKAFPFE